MKTEKEILEFLETLVFNRFSKKELDNKFEEFFGQKMRNSKSTCEDCKDYDHSVIYSTQQEGVEDFVDMEVYFLYMRNKHLFITETTLLEYAVNVKG